MTDPDLPSEIATGAQMRGNELGWPISSFLHALANAEALGYTCLGGQFQFRLEDGTCEMYWLSADSGDREQGETWLAYCKRACIEVKIGFEKLVAETVFLKQGWDWQPVRQAMKQGVDVMKKLVFVAYFVDESEWSQLQRRPV
jgi:hypothetical protein